MNELLNKITQGDCLEVMERIPDKSVDMILCDLPYGTTACKWDAIIPFDYLWEQYERVIKDNGAIVLTASQPFTSALVMSNPNLFRYEWIWDKVMGSNFVHAKKMPLKTHESILVFYKKLPTYNPQMTEADIRKNRPPNAGREDKSEILRVGGGRLIESSDRDRTKRYPKSIYTLNRQTADCNPIYRVHPTQKPVSLFEYLIRTYTQEGEVILDNCVGSGTTAVAAINTNRQFIGIERESEYVEIGNRRIAEAIKRKEDYDVKQQTESIRVEDNGATKESGLHAR
jgi:site-specific DNA-methyltransferase (adenine-specific)